MIVKILNYGDVGNLKFIEYGIYGLLSTQIDYLMENLEEETSINEDVLIIKMYFESKLYPFQSGAAKFRLDDFVAREEIEMAMFLSSFLEDMV
ncbi:MULTISPECIES: DUF5750 family protein [Methanobrevibacter]|uniref:Uncharacterized protein n=1 Tax=Methanobrevibacter gottschalkii DSM 11977 TaxID=1122229 RepID=A0A3N5BLF1_9EURY|nr:MULTISPECIES: DUF5750 family protein [Methanobrevibacter]OEC99584.1 hypothetical protein A9505_03580 [Methanobrevibacter sp. A27]RPF50508.1 hypothetical protein EDC42_1787 [Methanobrevibacter gottschalkii DSM 11977]